MRVKPPSEQKTGTRGAKRIKFSEKSAHLRVYVKNVNRFSGIRQKCLSEVSQRMRRFPPFFTGFPLTIGVARREQESEGVGVPHILGVIS